MDFHTIVDKLEKKKINVLVMIVFQNPKFSTTECSVLILHSSFEKEVEIEFIRDDLNHKDCDN